MNKTYINGGEYNEKIFSLVVVAMLLLLTSIPVLADPKGVPDPTDTTVVYPFPVVIVNE